MLKHSRLSGALKVFMLLSFFLCGSARANADLLITEPADGAGAAQRLIVAGTTSDPSATIWVVAHPLGGAVFWVQPAISVRQDGRWKTLVHIGAAGSEHVGLVFEIMAFANPAQTLREGLQLSAWPEAEARSQLIEVTRE
jgi:hypothetical protein